MLSREEVMLYELRALKSGFVTLKIDQAVKFVKLWSQIEDDKRAQSWWYMAEAIRYDSSILKEISLCLLEV